MINTDKYEGHTPAEKWAKVVWGKNPRHESKGELPTCLVLLNMDENGKETYATLTDQILMADAALLLEEVKRLRQGIIDIADKWERPSILRGFLKELMELIE
jgi:hypothetical protein